jgi:polysaccharide biosynthesis transport protein
VTGQALAETIKALGEAQSRRATLEGEYQQARQAGADYGSIPSVARSPLVAEAQRAVTTTQTKLAELQYNLGPAHFRVLQAQAELDDLRATLRRNQLAAVAVLNREYEAARNTEQTLASFLSSARGAAQNVNRQEFELAVLERDYQSNKQLYEVFMSRAKETNLMGDLQPTVARIVDRAQPAGAPFKPQKAQIMAISLVLTLLLGAIASIVMDRLDNTIKGSDDAENRLKLPVLAALPMVADHNRPKMARLFLDESHSHFAEGIRTARTGVMLSNLDVPHKTLLVTSTLPGEGKTTVSINLALAHAQTKRTLLIDGDMRRSQAGRALGLSAGAKGMTNLVAGTATVEECISQVEGSPLWVLGVGDIPPNPLDLLLSQRFKDVLAELQASSR